MGGGATRPPRRGKPVNTAPLSDSSPAGSPYVLVAACEDSVDVTGGEDPPGGGGDAEPGVVVDDVEDFDVGVVGEPNVGDVELPALVRLVGAEALVAAFRGFVGCGVTNPRLVRIRQIVDTAGTPPWRCSR